MISLKKYKISGPIKSRMVNVKTRPSNLEDKLGKLSQNSEKMSPPKLNETNEAIFSDIAWRYNMQIMFLKRKR